MDKEELTLADKLASLRASRSEFPVSALLQLYLAAPSLLYKNYFEGFRGLQKWLAPVDMQEIQEQEEYNIPSFAHTYEVQELAVLLHCNQGKLFKLLWKLSQQHLRQQELIQDYNNSVTAV